MFNDIPVLDRLFISILPRDDPIDSIILNFIVPWPMNLIFTQEAMNTYNDVLHFNLKLKKARYVAEYNTKSLEYHYRT